MYLNDGKTCKIVKDEYVRSIIKQHIELARQSDSTRFVIVALEKDNMCFIVDELFENKKEFDKRIASLLLQGYKVTTNENSRRTES